jgi:uncharacterized membrane protein
MPADDPEVPSEAEHARPGRPGPGRHRPASRHVAPSDEPPREPEDQPGRPDRALPGERHSAPDPAAARLDRHPADHHPAEHHPADRHAAEHRPGSADREGDPLPRRTPAAPGVRRHTTGSDPWETSPAGHRAQPPSARTADTGPQPAGGRVLPPPLHTLAAQRHAPPPGGGARGDGSGPQERTARIRPDLLGERSAGRPDGAAAPAELFVETTAETPALPRDEPLTDRRREAPPAQPAAQPGPSAVELDGVSGRRRRDRSGRAAAARAATKAGHGHGHGHGHTPAPRAGRRVRVLIAALLVPCALATILGVVVLWPSGGLPDTARPVTQEPVRAEVTATRATDCSEGSGDAGCVAVIVRMADGPRAGRDLVQVVPVEPGSPQFAVGDQVVLGWSGADPDDPGSYQIVDFQRGAPLVWLAVVFAAAVLLLGRWRGLAALAALALSFVVLLWFVMPAMLAGHDPLAVAIVGSCLIMFAVLYLTHGLSARTSTAVLGTLLSLALIGALAAAFSALAQLTGLDDQSQNLIATLGTAVDARGLLLAGVVIGALGVLDDVTVTQTSAVWELHRADPGLGTRGLFAAAMRIGRDHVASAVNTLVLAYAGASLPLLLLFTLSGRALGDVVTTQDVATEIVRTLVGSIGLVASVPITTALAAMVASQEKIPE